MEAKFMSVVISSEIAALQILLEQELRVTT